MNLREERYRLTIEPKNEVEVAFMEEVLNLRKDGDTCIAKRKNSSGLSCMAYLEIKKDEHREKSEARPWRPTNLEEFLANSSSPHTTINKTSNFIVSGTRMACEITDSQSLPDDREGRIDALCKTMVDLMAKPMRREVRIEMMAMLIAIEEASV